MKINDMTQMSKLNNLKKDEGKGKSTNDFIKILKGSIIALILTIIMLTIYAAILSFTNVSENYMDIIIILISGISLLIGSSITNIKIKRKGIINGGSIGLVYIFIIYFLSSIITGVFSFNINSIIMITVSIITGMVGGIIGVNMK